MFHLILGGVFVSLITEVLKKKKKSDKALTLWTLISLAVGVSLLSMWILDYSFWPTLGWVLVWAGAFYAYVLRNIKGK